jgi:DNA repair protein RecO (recombination protein O)
VPERGRLYRTEAVILRRQDMGETDRLLTLFSPAQGKLRAVAKGVRRPGSRKAGHLEPFSRVDLLLARGRELDVITQAEAVSLYPHLREDLLRLGQAAYLVELVDRFAVEQEGHPALYRLLVDMLAELDAGQEPGAVLRYYQLRLLELVGYQPELFRCLSCGEALQPVAQFFSVSEGGVRCPHCGPTQLDSRPLSLSALKVLRHNQRSAFAEAAAPRIAPAVAQEVEALLEAYLSYLLERKLRAPDFVRDVQRLLETGA